MDQKDERIAPETDVPAQSQPFSQPEAFGSQPQPIVAPAQAPQAITDQWQTKQEYKEARSFKQASPEKQRTFARIAKCALIIFGLSALVLFLAAVTPLGQVGSFTGNQDRAQTAYPIIGISSLVLAISYFVMVIANIVAARRSHTRSLSIFGLVIGIVLVVNPIGLVVMMFVVMCNLQSCSGS